MSRLLAICLLLALCIAPRAARAEEADTVRGEDELVAWIAQHQAEGGRVRLEGDSASGYFNITQYIDIPADTAAPFTIDTGAYGILLEGGLFFGNNLMITGQGADVPVVTVARVPFRTNWNNIVQDLHITATGNAAGEGGTALRIACAGAGAFDMSGVLEEGAIRASGANAIGLLLDAPEAVYCLNITVEGEGGVAVSAPPGTVLRFCKLTAVGNGALTVPAGVVADACAVSPSAEDAVTRRIAPLSLETLYLAVKQGDSFGPMDLIPFVTQAYILESAGAAPPLVETLNVRWDTAWALAHIDTSAPGLTAVPGELVPPLQGLGLHEKPLTLLVEVRDPAEPFISGITAFDDGPDGQGVQLFLWDSYAPGQASLLLSTDGGRSYQDISADPRVKLWPQPGTILVYFDEAPETLQFQLVLSDGRKSNTALYDTRYGLYAGGSGGDRTGADRDGAQDTPGGGGAYWQPPPPQATPAPTPIQQAEPPARPPEEAEPISAAPRRAAEPPKSEAPPAVETPPPPSEWEDETTSALSGARINALALAQGEAVTFAKQGVRLLVDAAALTALGLEDHQLFTVAIAKGADGAVSVAFAVDGAAITLPYTLHMDAPAAAVQSAQEAAETTPAPVAAIPEAEAPSKAPGGIPAGMAIALVSCGMLGMGGGGAYLHARRGRRR